MGWGSRVRRFAETLGIVLVVGHWVREDVVIGRRKGCQWVVCDGVVANGLVRKRW